MHPILLMQKLQKKLSLNTQYSLILLHMLTQYPICIFIFSSVSITILQFSVIENIQLYVLNVYAYDITKQNTVY